MMEKFIQEFAEALNGGRGALDAWLECNNEADCRAAINGYAQAREAELVAHVERLREALSIAMVGGDYLATERNQLESVLATTPAQSLAAITDPLNAHIERLQKTLLQVEDYLRNCVNSPRTAQAIANALSDIPAQSLARLRNEVLEDAAMVCEQATTIGACIAAIRELKEPECSSRDPN